MNSQAVANKVLRRINASKGSVWSAKDLLDLGTRASVDQALRRLTQAGKIRRVARGLYDFPRTGRLVGKRSPMPQAVAQAAARAKGAQARPTGAAAANALGLSTQVPADALFITDGPSKKIDVAGTRVRLKKVSPKRLSISPAAGTVLEALRYIGSDAAGRLTKADIRRISRTLKRSDVHQLRKAMYHAPDWMQPTVKSIVAHALAGRAAG